ncbi:hypothetical protein Ddye_030341 [Dipteronia dyeriana]|uniref:hAT-like transposase RNase-H fold domain-containing protein n=1 Tax=Dipteronia dyeriana TaxID=168575 RepID=A0AAD9WLD9_9ROSI|nr:hypothetical protein Ddye_030341 [Dipteronia dyeriana]
MASTMKYKFEKYCGSLETMNKLFIIAVLLDHMYKLQYVSYFFTVLYGVGSCESITANIKDALVELYESYNALYGGSGGGGSGSTNGGGSVDEIPLFCGGEIDDSSILTFRSLFLRRLRSTMVEMRRKGLDFGAINAFYGAMKNFKNFNFMDCIY